MAQSKPDTAKLRIVVSYATPHSGREISISMTPGATAGEAIRVSGILDEVRAIGLDLYAIGIWGKVQSLDARLRDGDRVEIYRPLHADPKETRRQRAAGKRC